MLCAAICPNWSCELRRVYTSVSDYELYEWLRKNMRLLAFFFVGMPLDLHADAYATWRIGAFRSSCIEIARVRISKCGWSTQDGSALMFTLWTVNFT